jgi:hypothetical protein
MEQNIAIALEPGYLDAQDADRRSCSDSPRIGWW